LSKSELIYAQSEKEMLSIVFGVQLFRCYLYGLHFTVVTDHLPLTAIRLNKTNKSDNNFDFKIVYRAGKKHVDSDSLSRIPQQEIQWDLPNNYDPVELSYFLTPTDFVSLQQSDPFCIKISQSLIEKHPRALRQFVKMNNVLYYIAKGFSRLVVPHSRIREIIHNHHNTPFSGHRGREVTFHSISSLYFWPTLREDVTQYTRCCDTCQRNKDPVRKKQGLLHPIEGLPIPFHTISIDFAGPLPATEKGNKYLLVATDLFPRYVEVEPTSYQTSSTVIHFLLHSIISSHSSPSILISDNGPCFISVELKEFLNKMNIHHRLTSPYHPQANPTERQNRTIKMTLKLLRHGNPDLQWDELIPLIKLSLNTARQSRLRTSAFELVYGRRSVNPFDYNLPTLGYTERITDLRRLVSLRRQAEILINQENIHKKTIFDATHVDNTYSVGSLCLLLSPFSITSPTSQFPSRWNGPFLIIKQTGPLSYRIQRLSDGRMFRSHITRMKPYHVDSSFIDADDFLDPVSWLSHAKDFHDNLNNPGFVDEFLTRTPTSVTPNLPFTEIGTYYVLSSPPSPLSLHSLISEQNCGSLLIFAFSLKSQSLLNWLSDPPATYAISLIESHPDYIAGEIIFPSSHRKLYLPFVVLLISSLPTIKIVAMSTIYDFLSTSPMFPCCVILSSSLDIYPFCAALAFLSLWHSYDYKRPSFPELLSQFSCKSPRTMEIDLLRRLLRLAISCARSLLSCQPPEHLSPVSHIPIEDESDEDDVPSAHLPPISPPDSVLEHAPPNSPASFDSVALESDSLLRTLFPTQESILSSPTFPSTPPLPTRTRAGRVVCPPSYLRDYILD
jgi:transposase InsO family protein